MDNRNHPKPDLVDPYDLPAELAPTPRQGEPSEPARPVPQRQPERRRDGRATDATR